jgi:hypothetical protein
MRPRLPQGRYPGLRVRGAGGGDPRARLVGLYSGQALFDELVSLMAAKGFLLNDIEPGFRDERSGQLLQVDALFVACT